MTIGADGEVMHSHHVGNSGTVRLRLLKSSPTNGQLMDMLKAQRASGSEWGRNLIGLRDFVRGDKLVASDVAFTGPPSLSFGKVGPINEWVFHAGHITEVLDKGVPPPTV
jgi:hypothetical protein